MRATWLSVALTLACAGCTCGGRTPPPPEVTSVSPAELPRERGGTIVIAGRHFLGRVVDSIGASEPARLDLQFQVRIGDTPLALEAVSYLSEEALSAEVPAGLPVGVHAVTVIAPDGRSATREGALQVLAEARLSLEDAPGGSGTPLGPLTLLTTAAPVVVHAVLRDPAGAYLGPAEVTFSLTGEAVTLAVGSGGTSATLEVEQPGAATLLADHPDEGIADVALDLTVTLAPPTLLTLVEAPSSLVAGRCAGKLVLVTTDALGRESPPPESAPLELASTSVAGTFHADAACSTPPPAGWPLGSAQVELWYRDTQAGPSTLTASLPGFDPVAHEVQILPAALDHFTFKKIRSPQVKDVSFAASISARDAFENLVETFQEAVALSLHPAGLLQCAVGCSNAGATAPFVEGKWTGALSVATAATGVEGVAAAAGRTGRSNAFDVLAAALTSPPTVRVTATPGVVRVGEPIQFDASESSDYTTPVEVLEASWDFLGSASGEPPWSGWSTSLTAAHTYAVAGQFTVRLAVRDEDGHIGYGFVPVRVLAPTAPLCVVDTGTLEDDGASDCVTSLGDDGHLSLPEALRLSNETPQRETIAFAGGLQIGAAGTTWDATVTQGVEIVGQPGVAIFGARLKIEGGASTLSRVELLSSEDSLEVREGAMLTLVGVTVDTMPSLEVFGRLDAVRSSFTACGGTTACIVTRDNGSVRLRFSSIVDAPQASAVWGESCGPESLELQSNVFARLANALRVTGCSNTRVLHNTFDQSTGALAYQGVTTGHVVRNNVFTRHSANAGVGCAGLFTERDAHLFFQNPPGCLAADSGSLTGDPLYLVPGADFRLGEASPAVDTALDLGLDLNDEAPGRFYGVGPDRGGRETW